MLAFLSYSSLDRKAAARISAFFSGIEVPTFMAHEDINVSREWQEEILTQIERADIFVAILSANYLSSPYCLQESGTAVFRQKRMTIIPLSIDGTVSPGFMAHIQSRRLDPDKPDQKVLFAGLAKYNCAFTIDCLINEVGLSRSYRQAEANFELLLPYLDRASDEQVVDILEAAARNDQIRHAGLCATKYLPPLFASHRHLLNKDDRDELRKVFERYGSEK